MSTQQFRTQTLIWNSWKTVTSCYVHLILLICVQFHGCLLWSAPLYVNNNLHHVALADNNVEVDQATRWGGNDVAFDVRFLGLRCLFILEFLILVTCEFGNQAVLSCLGFSCMKNIMFTLCLSLWESNEPGIMRSANLSGRFFRRSWRTSPRVYRWKAQPKISHGEISREIRFQCNWHRLQRL